MMRRAPRRKQDAWSQYFASAAAAQRSERRRIHAAALAALLLHGLFFALRLPESRRTVLEAPKPIPFLLHEFRPRPRPVEPPPPTVVAQPTVQPTIIVPGPPEIDIVPAEEPILATLEPLVPRIGPLDYVPITPPPAPEPAPVRYDSSIDRPQRLYAPLPSYTPTARRVRRQGRVVLEAVIDEHGAVTEAKVLKGLGFGLDESALRTVGTWRFEPARRNGRPIAVIYNLVINFRLR